MLNNNSEIWKNIQNTDKRYQVSSFGNIRSTITNHGIKKYTVRKLFVRSQSCAYLGVGISIKGIHTNLVVHREVAKAFIPNVHNKLQVNHIDGNKLNNNVYNLEWVTCSENHLHSFSIGLRSRQTSTDIMIGTRRSKYSSYHNVSWDTSRQKWIAGVKHKGKVLDSKRFNTELEAAKYVNEIIHKYKLNRPLNTIV